MQGKLRLRFWKFEFLKEGKTIFLCHSKSRSREIGSLWKQAMKSDHLVHTDGACVVTFGSGPAASTTVFKVSILCYCFFDWKQNFYFANAYRKRTIPKIDSRVSSTLDSDWPHEKRASCFPPHMCFSLIRGDDHFPRGNGTFIWKQWCARRLRAISFMVVIILYIDEHMSSRNKSTKDSRRSDPINISVAKKL